MIFSKFVASKQDPVSGFRLTGFWIFSVADIFWLLNYITNESVTATVRHCKFY